MSAIMPIELPAGVLLRRYAETGYADCYVTGISVAVGLRPFVEAFYTTPLFKAERALLAAFAGRPSSDADAAALAAGSVQAFAAWRVEARRDDELLLADLSGRTRSWLMVQPCGGGTRLHFGSAVVPRIDRHTGRSRMGPGFHALLGFHRLYSKLLLGAARRRLLRQPG
jgi:hypothetical protein